MGKWEGPLTQGFDWFYIPQMVFDLLRSSNIYTFISDSCICSFNYLPMLLILQNQCIFSTLSQDYSWIFFWTKRFIQFVTDSTHCGSNRAQLKDAKYMHLPENRLTMILQPVFSFYSIPDKLSSLYINSIIRLMFTVCIQDDGLNRLTVLRPEYPQTHLLIQLQFSQLPPQQLCIHSRSIIRNTFRATLLLQLQILN